jgi:hypothetical protein
MCGPRTSLQKGWSPLGYPDAFRGFSQSLHSNANTVRPLSFTLFQIHYPLFIPSQTPAEQVIFLNSEVMLRSPFFWNEAPRRWEIHSRRFVTASLESKGS